MSSNLEPAKKSDLTDFTQNESRDSGISGSPKKNDASELYNAMDDKCCIFATLKDKFDTVPHLSSDGKTPNAAPNLTNLLCDEILSDENKLNSTPNSMKKKRVPKELTLASLIDYDADFTYDDKPKSTSIQKNTLEALKKLEALKNTLEVQKKLKARENYEACINLQKACPFLENSEEFNSYKGILLLRKDKTPPIDLRHYFLPQHHPAEASETEIRIVIAFVVMFLLACIVAIIYVFIQFLKLGILPAIIASVVTIIVLIVTILA